VLSRFISGILIILLLPFGILIAIIILFDDGYPIFFKQNRVGINNKIFSLYKFRTMFKNTPNIATDKLNKPDQYYIRTGSLLRRLSIDELPQLFNILTGDMGFIGPRPALYNQVELIEKRKKLGIDKLMAGVTGWAQINGRDYLSNDAKVSLDEYYMINKSYYLDFKIIFLSILKIIKMDNVK